MTRKRKRRKLRIGRIFLLLFFIAAVFSLISFFSYQSNIKPIQENSEEVLFTVNPGSSIRSVINDLADQGIIKSAGSAKSWDLDTIFMTLSDASKAIAYDATVTIVEGDWATEIATAISSVTNVSREELLDLWNDRSYIESLMPAYPFLTEEMFNPDVRCYLEGYLAPNTYKFFQDTTAKEVTEKILDETLKIYNKYEKEFKNSEYSIHELFTLSSIVQHEGNSYETMRMIAQVFYNRLEIGMPLQSSSTTCYVIEEHSGNWVACEVNSEFDSPYNTYMYPGLTPGAILNPGEQAIEATLNPDPKAKNYMYFMADVEGDGTIYFAETIEEHEANVARYLQ